MVAAVDGGRGKPVGREPELELLLDYLDRRAVRGLVLQGGPGIGKTTLWEAALEAGRNRGMRVLATRASGADAHLSFAGLIDLLDGVDLRRIEGVPGPQLAALEVALLRAEPAGTPPDRGAIAFGFRNALRAIAAERPLLVAVDDLQWLDAPSGDALAFAARRLTESGAAFVLARRPGRTVPLERALAPLKRLDVGPLGLGAIRRMLADRLELSLPRRLLRQIVDATLGNPLFALELGRGLAAGDLPAIGEELPVPDAVEDLLGTRVARLPNRVRLLLLAVALSDAPRTWQLERLADTGALEAAVDAGVLEVEGDRVRASHPLLAAAARKRARPRERRELHLALAAVVDDDELRGRHLALAADRPDDEVATTAATAAACASARGNAGEAAELAEHALRLTPPGSTDRHDRLLALGHLLAIAGEQRRVTELIAPAVESLPTGVLRARAYMILTGGVVETGARARDYLERALAECDDDPGLRAEVTGELAAGQLAVRVERIHEAERPLVEALPAARRRGPQSEQVVLNALAWARVLGGRPVDDLARRSSALSGDASYLLWSIDRIAGQRCVWRGETERARALFEPLLVAADERSELLPYALTRLHLCELELRCGRWDSAGRLLDEWADSYERELLEWPMYERCQALLAAGRGLVAETERWAADALARAEETGVVWDRLETMRARGQAALLDHDPSAAVDALRPVWQHAEREHVEDPGAFPVAPDLVEALVDLGEIDEARTVSAGLHRLAVEQDHPWALAGAGRCEAALALCDVTAVAGAAEAAAAADAYGGLGLCFDRARTLLLLGRGQRRRRKWGASRAALREAVAAFEELGSGGWAEEARTELARVAGRSPTSAGILTPAEERVAALAAEGRANKEIAQALFVSVHTVEAHLSRIYAKLGIRSRTQLGRALTHG